MLMKNNTKNKKSLQPKLRFYEFRDKDGWEETNIGSIGNFYYGKSAPKWSLEENALTPCVRYGELYTKFGPVITKTYSLTNIKPNELRFSKGGEILIPRVGEKPEDFGKNCCYLPLENIAIGEMISVFETSQNPLFYTYYFRNLYKEFAKVVEGQNVKNLYYSELEPLTVFRPSPSEQQKIADCLSSLDELIEAEDQKLETLGTYKKGLMQQLFPQAGETTPRLRFPEFTNTSTWEVKSLGKIYTLKGGNSLSRDKLSYESGEVKNIHYGDIHTKFSTLFDLTKEFVPYIKSSELNYSLKSDNYCIEGDVIFADASEDLNDIGKNIEIINLNGQRLVSGLHTILARQSSPVLIIGFAGYLFQSCSVRQQIQKESQGAKVLGISGTRLAKVIISFPSNKSEQQKILDIFSSLDDLIASQITKLNSLRLHKKGLMQQLFPNVSEVKE